MHIVEVANVTSFICSMFFFCRVYGIHFTLDCNICDIVYLFHTSVSPTFKPKRSKRNPTFLIDIAVGVIVIVIRMLLVDQNY